MKGIVLAGGFGTCIFRENGTMVPLDRRTIPRRTAYHHIASWLTDSSRSEVLSRA